MNIPLSEPEITDSDIDEIVSVLRSSRLSLGPKLREFEDLVGEFVEQPHAIGVSSGTAGLHVCLHAMGIGEGDEVIVPSFTFIAAANAIRYVNATPVFVDIEGTTLNLDPALIEAAITAKTRAIMVVHTFGFSANMGAIMALARRHKLRVVEDACEAIGARYNGRRVGTFGDAAVFAFYPNKQITTGEGGMIVTGDAGLARELRALRNQGRYPSDSWHQHSIVGFNYRLSEINAALGCAQMKRLESILERRAEVAGRYRAALGGQHGMVLPEDAWPGCQVSWFVYVVRLPRGYLQAHRDEVVERMGKRGIQCGRYFAPIHTQAAYKDAALRFALPVTEYESERTVALPFFTGMSEKQTFEVSESLIDIVRSIGARDDL